MGENSETETYLSILDNKFQICLLNKENLKYIYKKEFKIHNYSNYVDLNLLNKFLEDNIFKIEKLIGKFVKNISLIIEKKNINVINIGFKRKSYNSLINKRDLKNSLSEIKEIFKTNYPNEIIMHMIINKYLVNGEVHSLFDKNLEVDYFCLEVQFISISNNFVFELENVLKNYQIKVSRCIDANYILNFFKNDQIDIIQMAHRIKNGHNENEVALIPKNQKKRGFFEKFFQLFS